MRDAPRPRRRTPRRSLAPAATSGEPHGGALPRVVGALLRGQSELTLLAKAVAGMAQVDFVDDRLSLVSTMLASRPGALVLPPFDMDHTSTAPLVFRVRREVPSIPILVLSSHPSGAGQPMLRAAQAGAHVITSPTAAELRAALASLLEPHGAAQ